MIPKGAGLLFVNLGRKEMIPDGLLQPGVVLLPPLPQGARLGLLTPEEAMRVHPVTP